MKYTRMNKLTDKLTEPSLDSINVDELAIEKFGRWGSDDPDGLDKIHWKEGARYMLAHCKEILRKNKND